MICVESGETFGSVSWGYTKTRDGVITLTGGQPTDARAAGASAELEDVRRSFYSGFFQHSLSGFARGSATLTAQHRAALRSVAETGLVHRIVLVGANDNSGGPEQRADLSLRRAEAARDALVRLGVSASLIEVQGHGVAARVRNPAGVAVLENRRVDIHVERGTTPTNVNQEGSALEALRLRRQDPRRTFRELLDLINTLQITPGTDSRAKRQSAHPPHRCTAALAPARSSVPAVDELYGSTIRALLARARARSRARSFHAWSGRWSRRASSIGSGTMRGGSRHEPGDVQTKRWSVVMSDGSDHERKRRGANRAQQVQGDAIRKASVRPAPSRPCRSSTRRYARRGGPWTTRRAPGCRAASVTISAASARPAAAPCRSGRPTAIMSMRPTARPLLRHRAPAARRPARRVRILGRVRVHTDEVAAASAQAVGAQAYTVGNDIVFGAGQYSPGTAAGDHLLAHELAHVGQQGGAGLLIQRKIDPAVLPTKQAAEIMADETYVDTGIDKLEYFFAEEAKVYYKDGSTLKLGLLPENLTPPIEGVNYRSSGADIPTVATDKPGEITYLPGARSLGAGAGGKLSLPEIVKRFSETARFKHESASNRIVPTVINSRTAPMLCSLLRDCEKQYEALMTEVSKGGVKIFKSFETVLMIYSLLPAGGLAGRAAAGAAAGVNVAKAEATILSELLAILKSGAGKSIVAEGVEFNSVRILREATQLIIRRFGIRRLTAAAGEGRIVHGAFERAAIQAAKQTGAKSVRLIMETPVNQAWKTYLESQGYAMEVIEKVGEVGFENVLTKVFTL